MLGFFQSLLLAQTWTYFKLGEWNGPAWTLSAEVLGYFIFPFIATRIVRIMSAAVCILCAFMCLVILSLVLLATHHAFEYQNPSGTIGAARMIFEFICGMFMQRYFILQIEPRMAPDSIICGALGFIILTLFIPALAMLCAFAFAVLIVGLAYNRGTVRYIFENKFSFFMGKISFSFYLIHGFVISFASWLCRARAPFVSLYDNPMSVVIVLLLCLSLSLLTYWLIERPFQKLGRSIANNQPA
jgi:peptidoglycan/LPS O-acetylase OafA/YrhL